MASTAEQLNNVVEKTKRLIALCSALQEENDLLKLENQTLLAAVNAGKEKTKDLEEKMRVLKQLRDWLVTSDGIVIVV